MNRRIPCLLALCLLAALPMAAASGEEVSLLALEPAPATTGTALEGDVLDLSQANGEVAAPDAKSGTSAANGIVRQGSCGDNVHWKLDSSGLLTIYGKGDMDKDFAFWYEIPFGKGIKRAVVKKGVTSISISCFNSCSELESVSLPRGLKNIWAGAFNDCSALRTIAIPKGVPFISGYAFNGCHRLESVVLPSTVREIVWHAFEDCVSLKRIDLPKALTDIGAAAFKGCTRMETAMLPENVCRIADDAFDGCPQLTIEGYSGTVAQRYADARGIPFRSLGEVQLKSIKLNKSGTVTLKKGKTLQLKATLTPRGALTNLTWTTSKRKVATVTADGKVKAVGKGTATITVRTANGQKATVKIRVK